MPKVAELMSRNIANTITNAQTWGGVIYNVKSFGAKGDGVTDDYSALNTLINTTINGEEAVIVISDGEYVIGTDITIPSNITLWFLRGGNLKPSSGVTITINGSIEAGIYQIFTGDGIITGNIKSEYILPQWFGAKGDGSNDDKTALQKALDIVNANGGTVYLPPGTYNISSSIRIYGNNVSLIGAGQGSTTINNTSTSSDSIIMTDNWLKESVTIQDLSITAYSANNGIAINMVDVHRSHINNVLIKNHQYGLYFGADCFDIYCKEINILDLAANGSAITLILGSNGGGIWVTDSTIDCGDASGTYGIKIVSGSGLFLTNIDVRNAKQNAVIIVPGDGDAVLYGWFTNVLADTSGSTGIQIAPGNTGLVYGMTFVDCWASTNGAHGIVVESEGTIDGLEFIGQRCYDNQQSGMFIGGGKNISILGGQFSGNSKAAANAYNGIHIGSGVSEFKIQNTRCGPSAGRGTGQAIGIRIDDGASDNYMITGNDLRGNAFAGLDDNGTGLNKVVANNLL